MSVKNESVDELNYLSRKFESFSTDSNHSFQENRKSNMSMSPMSPAEHHVEEKHKPEVFNEDSKCLLEGKRLAMNVPEKILFIIDTSKESNVTPYEVESGKKFTPLNLIKRAVEMFLHAKSTIDPRHEYALMSLNGNVPKWICDFKNNLKPVIYNVTNIIETTVAEDEQHICDLSACFKMALENLDLEESMTIPKHVYRVILIYGRSQTTTSISDPTYFQMLVGHPHVFLDALYVHEPPTDDEDNEIEKVYGELQRLDTKGNSFILEVGRKAAELFSTMAKLVAHSLQRPKQLDADYKIALPDNSTDV